MPCARRGVVVQSWESTRPGSFSSDSRVRVVAGFQGGSLLSAGNSVRILDAIPWRAC